MLVLTACGTSSTAPAADSDEPPEWQGFDLGAMKAERAAQDVSYLTVMDDRRFRMGILRVPRSRELSVSSHRLDAIYYIDGGTARITADSADVQVEEGDAVFVRGDVEHRIWSVEADLDVLVVFRIASLAATDPELVAFSRDEMLQGVDPEISVFTPLLATSNVGLGMYLVPKGMDPDARMVHTVSELKIITDGTGRFDIGSTGMRVDPGSIAFIPREVQHQFRRVADALTVLVVWER